MLAYRQGGFDMRRLKARLLALILTLALIMPLAGCSLISDIAETLGITQLAPEPDYIKVTVPETTFENKFHYGGYSEADKETYRDIYQGLLEQKDEFIIHSKDGDHANNILYTVLYDFPEIFWTEGHVISTTYGNRYVCMKPKYNCTKEEKETKEVQIHSITQKVLEAAPKGADEYAKIKYVYEYLVTSVEYQDGAPDNQNIYSSLVNKKTVCAGYAKANQYLLEKLGISCVYVTGDATNTQGTQLHAWNIVSCNGKYYYVDVTWADPLELGEQQVQDALINYDYLCCSEETLKKTHVRSSDYPYPECNSDDLNYYKNHGMYYSEAKSSELLDVMKADINKKNACTTFKFANETVYGQGKDLITGSLLKEAAQYLGRKYGIKSVKCYYREENVNRFVIYWTYK